MTTTTDTSLRLTRLIQADPAKVFEAWTVPQQLNQWSAPEPMGVEAEVDLRVGGRYRLLMKGSDGGVFTAVGEYREIDPQFSVRGEEGLMVYGPGTDIPSGKAGRWHKERLHLSPFIYRTQEDGTRQGNADYNETGHYYDPVYGDKVIRFGVMSECESSSQ